MYINTVCTFIANNDNNNNKRVWTFTTIFDFFLNERKTVMYSWYFVLKKKSNTGRSNRTHHSINRTNFHIQSLLAARIKSKALFPCRRSYSLIRKKENHARNSVTSKYSIFLLYFFHQSLTRVHIIWVWWCACSTSTLDENESFTNFPQLRYVVWYAHFSRWNVLCLQISRVPSTSCTLLRFSYATFAAFFREFGRMFVWFIHGKCFRCSYSPVTVTVFPGKSIFPGVRIILSLVVLLSLQMVVVAQHKWYSSAWRIVKLSSQFVEIVWAKSENSVRRQETTSAMRYGMYHRIERV